MYKICCNWLMMHHKAKLREEHLLADVQLTVLQPTLSVTLSVTNWFK